MKNYAPGNKIFAKNLRKNMTKEERHLWYDFLRDYPVKFYRQRQIGSFIVDFYCHEAALVVEIDGSQHYTEEAVAYDKMRTEYLNRNHLNVIRFLNGDINNHFAGCCYVIDEHVKIALANKPTHNIYRKDDADV